MKIQFLNGGLANQTFQYIFTRFAQLRNPDNGSWYLDDSFFFIHDVHNGYELDKVFGLQPNLLSRFFDEDVWEYMILQKKEHNRSIPEQLLENGMGLYMIAEASNYTECNPFYGNVEHVRANEYIPELADLPGDVYFHGYWINKEYFNAYREQFINELRMPDITESHNLMYADMIRGSRSASLHVRRGDFLDFGWELPEDVIYRLVGSMHNEIPDMTLFVFSDDINWCKDNRKELGLDIPQETVFVEGNSGEMAFRDMQLMSMCKNMIIGTSSFNFLAALLNTGLEQYINVYGKRSLDNGK